MDDSTPNSSDAPAPETDPRFPSGSWRGFWLQRRIYANRRQQMELLLAFAAGIVTGEGRDLLDEFTVAGHYDRDSGEVTWTKKHLTLGYSVFYKGYAENKGIWGLGTSPTTTTASTSGPREPPTPPASTWPPKPKSPSSKQSR